jgi:hypothetical protein
MKPSGHPQRRCVAQRHIRSGLRPDKQVDGRIQITPHSHGGYRA